MGNNNNSDHINEVMNNHISNSVTVASVNDLKNKTQVNDQTAYVFAETFTGNPYQLLGQVIEIRKIDEKCPTSLVNNNALNFEFSPFPVTGFKIDEETKLSKPVLRSSIIVDKNITAQVGFLNYLSAQLDEKSSFSLMIMDQSKGLVDFHDPSWTTAVKSWKEDNAEKMTDPEICYIFVVSGFVQKNIIKKKYYQFEAEGKGGAYGININGKLSTSSDEYSLDIIFGLSPAIIKRPQSSDRKFEVTKHEISNSELRLFADVTGMSLNKALHKQ